MKLYVILLLLLSRVAIAQDSPSDFFDNPCIYKTNGQGQSLGIKIKMLVPCLWDSINEQRPYVAKEFNYKFTGGELLSAALIISNNGQLATKKDIDSIFSRTYIQDIFHDLGQLLTIRKVSIDNHSWAEYHFRYTINAPQGDLYQNSLCYNFLYRDKEIVIMYKTVAFQQNVSDELFNKYEFLFKSLASGILIYNHYQ